MMEIAFLLTLLIVSIILYFNNKRIEKLENDIEQLKQIKKSTTPHYKRNVSRTDSI